MALCLNLNLTYKMVEDNQVLHIGCPLIFTYVDSAYTYSNIHTHKCKTINKKFWKENRHVLPLEECSCETRCYVSGDSGSKKSVEEYNQNWNLWLLSRGQKLCHIGPIEPRASRLSSSTANQ